MRKLLILMTICGLLAVFISADESSDENKTQKPVELISHRTELSETFDTQDGKLLMKIYSRKQYYKEGEIYKKINLNSSEETKDGFTHVVNTGLYVYRYDPTEVSKGYRFERDQYSVTYRPTGKWTGKTTTITPMNEGVKEIIAFTSEADSSVSWEIDTNALVTFSNGELIFKDSTDTFLFRVPKPWAQDANRNYITITASYSHNILTYDLIMPDNVSWPITMDPSTVIGEDDVASGRLLSINEGSYTSARNSTTAGGPGGGVWSIHIIVGQRKNVEYYYVDRSSLVFDTSTLPDDATIDSAKVCLVAESKYTSGSEYTLYLVKGTYTGTEVSTDWFNDFTGWASSGVYSVTALANTITTSSFSPGDSLYFTLNSTGLSTISKTGNTTYMLLSSRDINETAPTGEEQVTYEDNSPYIKIWYSESIVEPPTTFTMTALNTTSIVCSWNDESDNEDAFYIINQADSSVVDSLAANAEADTISGLSENTKYVWMVVADAAGDKGYSEPDSAYTLISPPNSNNISILPISSDTLRIVADEPQNGTSGSTGMEVDALSGYGSTDSGWQTGEYSYSDGGLDPDSAYSYKVRFRNGDGESTEWSSTLNYSMKGLDTLVVNLTGDLFDDYNLDFGSGRRDSTVVRVGASDSGEKLDGFVSFSVPWFVVNGGVDSLFLSMARTNEGSSDAPTITVYGIPVKHEYPVEERSLGSQDSTSVHTSWTIDSGTGNRTSPNLRDIFREWQDIATSIKDFSYDFGLRLDDSLESSGVRAVFHDYSHPSYSNGTSLKIYYTPGYCESLENAPDNFSLTVLAPGSLRASWSDNSDNEYGFVILNFSDSTMAAGTDSLPQNTTSVDVNDITPNTEYEWFVRAYTAEDDLSSAEDNARTFARIPGTTTVTALTESSLRFILDPQDNPSYTQFAVQDSVTGLYVDGSAEPDTLRANPPGDWGWRTYTQWGAASGDTLTSLFPDSLYVIRAKARSNE